MKVKVLTWNIRHGLGMDNRQDLRRVLAVLKEADPDIAVLNEVDRHMARSGFVDQVKWLAAQLRMNHFFSPSIGLGPVAYGNAILTKGAFKTTAFSRLSCSWEPRKALLAEIRVYGVELLCIGVHLNVARSLRALEYAKLLTAIKATTGTLLLAGDFNSQPDCDGIKALSTILTDAFSHNPKPTFPAVDPRKRIDYLFTSSDCNIIDNEVLLVEGSDHLPLFTVIDM